MAKPDKPLLSLGARGTIGDALTYQRRGREHIVRQKPIPRDPYSLAQAYQRWDYKDYAYLWTLLSNSEKQVYRTAASRYHITGFSYWMRLRLKELTNLVGRWHLDERSGAIVYDSSRTGNNGTIVGPSPVAGTIDGAYYLDGINDDITWPSHPAYDITAEITIEFFCTPHWDNPLEVLLRRGWGSNGVYIAQLRNQKPYVAIYNYAFVPTNTFLFSTNPQPLDTPFHLLMTYDSTTLRLYVNGEEDSNDGGAWAHPIGSTTGQVLTTFLAGYRAKVTLDEIRLYNRICDPTEILRHSKRRYP